MVIASFVCIYYCVEYTRTLCVFCRGFGYRSDDSIDARIRISQTNEFVENRFVKLGSIIVTHRQEDRSFYETDSETFYIVFNPTFCGRDWCWSRGV